MHSQKIDTAKHLSQMENVLKALQVQQQKSQAATASPGSQQTAAAASGMDAKQLKAFTEQVRGILRVETATVFKTRKLQFYAFFIYGLPCILYSHQAPDFPFTSATRNSSFWALLSHDNNFRTRIPGED